MSKLWLKPLGTRVVVEWDRRSLEEMLPDNVRKTKLIAAPHSMRQQSMRGWVRAVGHDVKMLKVDDYIQFSPWAGQEGQAPLGNFYILIEEREIAAIIDHDALVQKLVDEETEKNTREEQASGELASIRDSLKAKLAVE